MKLESVYHKKYKKILPETDKVQGFACRMLILLIHSAFDIFKMASKIVANKLWERHLHVGIMMNL